MKEELKILTQSMSKFSGMTLQEPDTDVDGQVSVSNLNGSGRYHWRIAIRRFEQDRGREKFTPLLEAIWFALTHYKREKVVRPALTGDRA